MTVVLGGGEPFYREDILRIIEIISNNNIRYSILSNGTLVTEKLSEKLVIYKKRCNYIQISLDGSTESMHDIFRGPGTFLKVLEGIKILQKYEFPLSIRVTIHKQNVHYLDEIADFVLNELNIPKLTFSETCFWGLCKENTGFIQLSAEEKSFAIERLLVLANFHKGRIDLMDSLFTIPWRWTIMENARKEKRKPYSSEGHLSACNAIFSSIGVRADGVIIPCIQLSHIELGSINDAKLSDIWKNNIKINNLRNRNLIKMCGFEFCNKCDYERYCIGSCPALSYSICGCENYPVPAHCLKLFLDSGGKLPDEKLLFELKP